MGYTHYYDTDSVWTTDERKAMQDAANAIIRATSVPLAGWDGAPGTDPEVSAKRISLNGVEGVNDDAHESFIIGFAHESWTFCKTAEKPYDEVVVAMLVAAAEIKPDFSWSSDGEDRDHAKGKALWELAKESLTTRQEIERAQPTAEERIEGLEDKCHRLTKLCELLSARLTILEERK